MQPVIHPATAPGSDPSFPRVPLNSAALVRLADRVAVPSYERSGLVPGVVHLGVGNFHRAHQLVYFDSLANLGFGCWGVTGVSLRSHSLRDALARQDNLFTVVERDGQRTNARVIGVLRDYLYAPTQSSRVMAALSSPNTRLVTLTITGNGYPVNADGELLIDSQLRQELDDPQHPTTAFGYLVEALTRRRSHGGGGLTVLSCDNLPDSGAATRAAVMALAGRRSPELARWVEQEVSFPNAMVDRITPATTLQERRFLQETFQLDDRCPVMTEPFSQWVVEDAFIGDRPRLDEVGVQFVSDVTPYKLVKTRLLNGSHCALGYLGTFLGYSSTSAAMTDPLLRSAVERLMRYEVAPLLPPLPGTSVGDYQHVLLERFSNPEVADPLSRLCARGSTKMRSYLLPSLHESLRQGDPPPILVLAVAVWMRYLRGTDLGGSPVEVQDPLAAELAELAARGQHDPRPLLSRTDIFGDLGRHPGVVAALEATLKQLDEEGAAATITARLAGTGPTLTKEASR